MMRGYWAQPGFRDFGHHIGGAGILGMILMIILWIVAIAAIVLAIRALVVHSRHRSVAGATAMTGQAPAATIAGPGAGAPALRAIVEERYAKGEMTREEFLQRKADLGLGDPPATN